MAASFAFKSVWGIGRTRAGDVVYKSTIGRSETRFERRGSQSNAAVDVECCTVCEPDPETHRPAVFDQPRDSTMNGHGGKRPGAGRPKGAASRANEEVRQEAAATDELPFNPPRRAASPSRSRAGRFERQLSRTAIIALPSRWRTSRERFGHQIGRELGTMGRY
jgi:hypothetical protein